MQSLSEENVSLSEKEGTFNLSMKILHLFDMAGVAPLMCFYYSKLTENFAFNYLIKKEKSIHIAKMYPNNIVSFNRIRSLMMEAIRNRNYFDIVHIHSNEIFIPLFKLLGKKVVLHYHGSDINQKKRQIHPIRILCRSMADVILYNSEDMRKKVKTIKFVRKIYFPNFIDTELFKNNNHSRDGRSLLLVSNNLDIEKTIQTAQQSAPSELSIINLKKKIPHHKMPDLLSKYEYFIDEKVTDFGQYLKAFSSTGLQALASGTKVIHQNQTFTELPTENTPNYAIEKLEKIYNEL